MELEKLVKAYQGGDTSTREAIEGLLWDDENGGIANAVILKISGKPGLGFIDQKFGGTSANIEQFAFNNYEFNDVFNNSLDYALKTYKADGGKRFTSWFYDVFYGRLYNLKSQYLKQWQDGEIINTVEEFHQEIKAIFGDVYNPEALKECKFITDDDIEKMSNRQQKFIGMSIALLDKKKSITDAAAAEVLGVTERTIYNYKEELREILADSNEQRKAYQRRRQEDDLPGLFNEYGAKDPTPREAAKNIKSGNRETI